MPQYIHDTTEDELTHEVFINAYLASKGAGTVNLHRFRCLKTCGRGARRGKFFLGSIGLLRGAHV